MAQDITGDTGPDPEPLSKQRAIWSTVAQVVLLPVLFFLGFGFAFFGYGLNEDGGPIIVYVMYLVLIVTYLLLFMGPPTLWIARRTGHHRVQRLAANVPLAFSAVSVAILIYLYVAATVFEQLIGV